MTRRYKVSLIVFTVILCILVVVVCAVAYIRTSLIGIWNDFPELYFENSRTFEENEEIADQIAGEIDKFFESNNISEDEIVYRYKNNNKDYGIDVRYKARMPDNDETVVFSISGGSRGFPIDFDISIEKKKDYSTKGTGIEYDKYIKFMEEIANEEMPKERLEKTLASGNEEGGYMENYSRFSYNYSIDEYGYEVLDLWATL